MQNKIPAPQKPGPDGAHQDISSFSKGMVVEGVYLLSKLDVRKTKHGADFYAFELADRTGSVPARQWECDPNNFNALTDAPVVYVSGTVDEWMNEIQLKVDSIEAVEASTEELRFLIPHTPFDVNALFKELQETFATLESPFLREMFERVFEDAHFVKQLKEVPAASSYHHAYLGGLLEHIVSLLRASEHMCAAYPRLNRDLVLVGAFLHDIGKVEELSWGRGFSYTTKGQLLGHIAIGTLMVERWSHLVPNFPGDLRDELIHLVLSHHGIREHGSPVLPVTPEALVVHFLDNLDGKLWSCFKAIDDVKSGDSEWSPYSKHMGRRIFRNNRVQAEENKPSELRVPRNLVAETPQPVKQTTSPVQAAPVVEPEKTKLPEQSPAELFAPLARVVPGDLSEDGEAPPKRERRSRSKPVRSKDRTPPLFG